MLANRITKIRQIRPLVPQRHSSQLFQTYPLTKLRAYPFQLSPEDAIIQMGAYASVLCFFKNILGSVAARYLPGFGFEPFRPMRIVPVYFPAWIVDAEAQVEISYKDMKRKATVHIHDSYLPGCDYKILSFVSLFSKQLRATQPVPFTPELQNQYGQEVACLPYSISPFTILDITHSLSYKDSTINEDLSFRPSSIKPELFAAYPVLIPLYLAQYDFAIPGTEIQRPLTLFMEAYSPTGRIFAERVDTGTEIRRIAPGAPPSFLNFTHILDGIDVQIMRGVSKPFIRIAGLSIPNSRELPRMAASWLNGLLETPSTAQTLASKSSELCNDDPRIRECTDEERFANHAWMRLSAEISSMNMIFEAMSSATSESRVTTIGVGKDVKPEVLMDGAVKALRTQIEGLESKREETKPSWWTAWLATSKKPSP